MLACLFIVRENKKKTPVAWTLYGDRNSMHIAPHCTPSLLFERRSDRSLHNFRITTAATNGIEMIFKRTRIAHWGLAIATSTRRIIKAWDDEHHKKILHKQTRCKSHKTKIVEFVHSPIAAHRSLCIGAYTDNSRRSSFSGKICNVFFYYIHNWYSLVAEHTDCYWTKWKQVLHTLETISRTLSIAFTVYACNRYVWFTGHVGCQVESETAESITFFNDNTISFQRILCTSDRLVVFGKKQTRKEYVERIKEK